MLATPSPHRAIGLNLRAAISVQRRVPSNPRDRPSFRWTRDANLRRRKVPFDLPMRRGERFKPSAAKSKIMIQ